MVFQSAPARIRPSLPYTNRLQETYANRSMSITQTTSENGAGFPNWNLQYMRKRPRGNSNNLSGYNFPIDQKVRRCGLQFGIIDTNISTCNIGSSLLLPFNMKIIVGCEINEYLCKRSRNRCARNNHSL